MKISYVFAITFFLILWESVLGHTRLFSELDLFPSIFVALYLSKRIDTRLLIYWGFVLGIFLDLVIGRWLGVYVLFVFVPIIILEIINRFIKVLSEERVYLAIVLFALFSQLLIYLLEIINGTGSPITMIMTRTLLNVVIAFGAYWIFSRSKKERAIKV